MRKFATIKYIFVNKHPLNVTMKRIILIGTLFTLIYIFNVNGQLNFFVVGDWGGNNSYPYTTSIETQVASSMGIMAKSLDVQLVVGVGDNFYDCGVTDVMDPRFKSTFEDVFTASSLQVRWYQTLGNHDHLGNISAQIAYTNFSDRWYMPNQWYSHTFNIPNSPGVTAQFLIIDTIALTGTWDDDAESPRGINTIEEKLLQQSQQDWIESELKSSNATWIFVFGHYPVYSIGHDGPTPYLVSYLLPLLEKYGVAAYISGHEHDLQYLNDGSTVNYYVSGTGHKIDTSQKNSSKVPKGSSKFFWPVNETIHGGYLSIQIIGNSSMTATFYDDTDLVLYTHTHKNPRN